jgi:iron complex outermembrane recepter protein
MFKRNKVSAGVLVALGSVLALPQVPVYAQERVEITGSRIRTLGATSNSPITSVSAEEFNSSAPVAVEEVIRSLPSAIPAIGPGTNNGSNGTASIDLRGLGTNRTLVLINGRRLVPATLGGVVDTNSIPVALLDRIDVVTGGASAVYGADAVAGVVNFMLKRNFTGLDARTTYGVSEQGDAKRYRTDVTLGANLAEGRGNVALSFGTSRTEALTQGERSFGEFQIASTNGARGGSTIGVPASYGGIPAPLTGNQIIDYATGGLRAFTTADEYNFNPLNYYVTPLERTQMSAIGRFTINEHAEAYAELTNTKSNVTLNLAPSGSFASAGFPSWRVPIGNPYIPDLMRTQLCAAYGIAPASCVAGNATEISINIGRRFVEYGPRINTFDNNTLQWTAGLRGSLPLLSSWSYDAYLQKGTSEQISRRVNWGSASKVQQALRALNTTSCTVTTGGCVPINLFGQAGSLTPAMLGFINQTAIQTTTVEQEVANVSFSGDLGPIKSPFARAPIGLAIGFEKRDVVAGNQSDAPSQVNGEVLGSGAPLPDRRGTLSLSETFLELSVPIASNLPGVESFNFEGGYRDSEFETIAGSKQYGSWKYGFDYAPIKGLRFRAMQQRATRAPNVNELYQPVVSGLSNRAVDPCQLALINTADATTPGTLSNLCRVTGVPAAQIGFVPAPAAGQISQQSGGNPNLSPEEADTLTVGLVFEPTFLPGLSVTVDYFKIEINKAVSTPTTSQVLDGCYTAALNPGFNPGNPFCALIARNTLTGSLNGTTGVSQQLSNLGKVNAEGYDLGVNYRLNAGAVGRFDIGLQATVTTESSFQSLPTVAVIDCLGFYGQDCGGPTAKTKWSQRTTWTLGDFSAGYNWRNLGKVRVQDIRAAGFAPQFREIKAYDYFDLNFAWSPTKNLSLTLVVTNATDKQPPEVGNTIATTATNSGNTFPQWYDVVGRSYSIGARLKF